MELTIRPGSGLTRRTYTRETEANPFLDNGWVWQSYEMHRDNGPEGADFEVDAEGHWEEATRTRGKRKGEKYMKLVGQAATYVRWIREAADKHEIGVAIQVEQAVKVTNAGKRNERTEDIPGQVLVKFLGKERKQYTAKDATNGDTENPEDDDNIGADTDDDGPDDTDE